MRWFSGTLPLLFLLPIGCGNFTTLEARNVPNPVLLGPVDRIGGAKGGPAKTLGTVREEVADFAAATTDTTRHGNVEVTTTTTVASSTGSVGVTAGILNATQGRPDRDVRVGRIPSGGWVFLTLGGVVCDRWIRLEGKAVEVRRDR